MPGPTRARARTGTGVRLVCLSARLLRAAIAAVVLAVLLAGIPWGLAHYVGQPLPTRVPSGDELITTLSTPLSTRDTLRILACVLWPTWAWFVLDVARTTRHAASAFPRPHLLSLLPLPVSSFSLTHTPPSPPPPPAPPPPRAAPPPPPPRPPPAPPPDQQPGTAAPDAGDPDGDQRVVTPTGAFVGLGLAALITAAWATLLLRRRIHYRPGHGQRKELPMAPVVRTLRLAHDRANPPAPDDRGLVELEPATSRAAPVPEAALRDRARHLAQTHAVDDRPAVGIADGRAIALDLARTRGLGLTGPGAQAAARALLVAILADHHRPGSPQTRLLTPAPDAALLLGPEITAPPQALRLCVTRDLEEALEVMERELLTRSRGAVSADSAGELVLVATSQPYADRRLQAILDNGSSLGLSGLLLGPWHPGTTVRVRQDGTVAATSPTAPGAPGVRLFTLPADETRDLIRLLREAIPPTATRLTPRREPAGTDGRAEEGRRGPDGSLGPVDDGSTRSASPPAGAAAPVAAAHQPSEGATGRPQEAGKAARLVVLGRLRLTRQPPGGAEPEISLAPRHRDLLAFLALHPAGVHRDVLCAALWPEARRPHNAFHATVSQLRKTLAAEAPSHESLVLHHEGHYRLDAGRLSVDLWQLQTELADFASRTTEQQERALHRIDELYQGELAADLAGDWLDAPREALRRDILNAHSLLVRSLRSSAPQKALHFLEISRQLDPHNETIYCEIARLQVHLGQRDGVPRTLALLTTALAEIDEEPSGEAIRFSDKARRPGIHHPGEP
ncbi:helix-turn-helix domain-containing protein [Streptomyces specialis]|uniref:helix-turn-helix domain-containing protein n=1 Tax=Streptomyces specialis TaxID=498367 RepID=UPI00073EABDE|nr:helix-turn-helix domain-containing protein [Streptomyces specialis]